MEKLCNGFTEYFLNLNRHTVAHFRNWAFLTGMLFESKKKWWDSKERKEPHEGVDLCFYRTKGMKLDRVRSGILVPSLFSGEVISVIEDYLGQSVFVFSFPDLLWAFGHIDLNGDLRKGRQVKKGEPVGTVSPGRGNHVLPHIHVSLGKLVGDLPCFFDWSLMKKRDVVELIDPMPCITRDYELIEGLDFNFDGKDNKK